MTGYLIHVDYSTGSIQFNPTEFSLIDVSPHPIYYNALVDEYAIYGYPCTSGVSVGYCLLSTVRNPHIAYTEMNIHGQALSDTDRKLLGEFNQYIFI